jgi:transcriptional regulator with XRE-family HTH domain
VARVNLAVIMDRLEVSQGEVARRTGLSRQTVFDAYHGRGPTTATMVKIAIALNVTLREIDPRAAQELSGLVIG